MHKSEGDAANFEYLKGIVRSHSASIEMRANALLQFLSQIAGVLDNHLQ
jgi:hypothetical protein